MIAHPTLEPHQYIADRILAALSQPSTSSADRAATPLKYLNALTQGR